MKTKEAHGNLGPDMGKAQKLKQKRGSWKYGS